jgi:uncharacterized membrane protein
MFITSSQRLYRKQEFMLFLCACLYGAVTCSYALARFYGAKTSLFDEGTFDQVLWNVLHHGVAHSTTTPPFNDRNWFGFHFSPILLLLVPFYAIWPHPELLQVVQSACFAFTGIVLFYALGAAGAKTKEAWAGVILYWCNPYTVSAALWDFHEIAIATLLMAMALWALCAQRFGAMVCCLALLLLTKEHYGMSVAGFGFLWGWKYGQWRRGLALMVIGIAAIPIVILLVMPFFNNGAPHPMFTHGASQLNRYSWLSQPWDFKIAMFLHLMLGAQGGSSSGLAYLFALLLGGFMLPLAAPLYLLAASSDLAANLLSANPMPRHWAAYHSAPIIPAVILAAYMGYVRTHAASKIHNHQNYKMVALLTVLYYGMTDLHIVHFWELGTPGAPYNREEVQRINRLIPPGGVSAQANIGAFFSQREAIYPFPYAPPSVQTVIFQLSQPFARDADRFNIPLGMSVQNYCMDIHALLRDPGWHIAYWHAPWLVMERGVSTANDQKERDVAAAQLDALYPGGR